MSYLNHGVAAILILCDFIVAFTLNWASWGGSPHAAALDAAALDVAALDAAAKALRTLHRCHSSRRRESQMLSFGLQRLKRIEEGEGKSGKSFPLFSMSVFARSCRPPSKFYRLMLHVFCARVTSQQRVNHYTLSPMTLSQIPHSSKCLALQMLWCMNEVGRYPHTPNL